jgi:hypothetical protein
MFALQESSQAEGVPIAVTLSPTESPSSMTFTEAAAQVLRLVGKPLHYKEITDVAIEKNLLSHVGKSPDVTMGARLAALVKKGDKENPLVRVRPGVFALREWDQAMIEKGLQDRTRLWRSSRVRGSTLLTSRSNERAVQRRLRPLARERRQMRKSRLPRPLKKSGPALTWLLTAASCLRPRTMMTSQSSATARQWPRLRSSWSTMPVRMVAAADAAGDVAGPGRGRTRR